MAVRASIIIFLRIFQVTITLVLIGLCAYIVHETHQIRKKGDEIFDKLTNFTATTKNTGDDFIVKQAQSFFDFIMVVPRRVYFAIGAGCFVLVSIILSAIISSWHRHAKHFKSLVCLETFTNVAIFVTFVCLLTFTMELLPFCTGIDFLGPELALIFRVCPVSKGNTAAAGVLWTLFLITTLLMLTQKCCGKERKNKKPTPPMMVQQYKDGVTVQVHSSV